MEFTLLARALLGVGAMWIAVRVLDRDGRLSERAPRPWDTLLGAIMVGLLVGRLWAMVAGGTNPLSAPLDILLIRGGVDTLGASIGALGALWWWSRPSPGRLLDALTLPALLGLAAWHGACGATGSCAGTETSLPWAIETVDGMGRHPVEVYAALGIVAIALLLHRVRSAPAGVVASLGLVAAAGVRALTEPLRFHLGDGPIGVYVAGVALGLGGLALAVRRGDDRAPEEEPAEDE